MYLHWNEYICEMLGTAILLFFGTSAIIINFGNDAFIKELISDEMARLFLTGLIFSGTAALVVISPLGKLSGGHINPAVSLPFWLLKRMHHRDLAGYITFQFIGATIGSTIALLAWGNEFWSVNGALTLPGSGISFLEAFIAETVMTFILVISILIMLSHHNTAKFTPLVVWIVIGLQVMLGAQISGTSINPARSFGPAIVTNVLQDLWIYLTAPIIGAVLAAAAHHAKIFGNLTLKTGKLFHAPSYKCIFLHCEICEKERMEKS
ncbi:MAG: MIP/aquaporin family protein [Nitrososphaerales archaeon]